MVNARTLLLVNVDLHCMEEGEGPPLVVHHGGPGLDHSTIEPHLRPLSEFFYLVFFDHRGTGRSATPQGAEPYHIDQFASDVEALTQTLGIPAFALLGHSFGGVVALHFALNHPQMLTHLVLVSTPVSHQYIKDVEDAIPRTLSPEALAELASLQNQPPSDYIIRRGIELLAPLYFHDPDRVSELNLESVRYGPETQAVWDSLEGFDLRPRLREIKVSTLVITGDHDVSVSVERAKQAADALPKGKLLVIKDSGHYPYIEAPEAFLSGVLDFLGVKVKKKGLFGRR